MATGPAAASVEPVAGIGWPDRCPSALGARAASTTTSVPHRSSGAGDVRQPAVAVRSIRDWFGDASQSDVVEPSTDHVHAAALSPMTSTSVSLRRRW